MSPSDPRHGKRAGYYAHRTSGQVACDPCRRAAAAYEQQLQLRRLQGLPSLMIDATGTRRRIQALRALGYTIDSIAAHMGVSRNRVSELTYATNVVRQVTAFKVAALYNRLSMKPPPAVTQREREGVTKAKRAARRNGWAPPLAWDSIDDPNEKPQGVYVAPVGSTEFNRERTAKRTADLEHAADIGHAMTRVLADLSITRDGLWKWCNYNGRDDLWNLFKSREDGYVREVA